ncbi:hypothetical protein G7Y89_g12911 [Cudoniella acicularis]|uniref:Autophagy protein n=1 Tax=Cudoniella acicularis TaxID=354080 RepID=A0A8H4VWI9_9HELO|nr:hypothetical protein G7Y89_g12911 [Cudoniella acicularis]
MGWFWGASDDKDPKASSSKSQDPLRDLDPTLRDFLAKESPVKYDSSNPPAESQTNAPVASESKFPVAEAGEDRGAAVPKESLYKDGRYADLWKTYRPQAEIEAEGKSDQEKMLDVLEGYKYRRAEIGKVALENCALEQLQVSDCFTKGGWSAKATMCRAENRKFERCYTMQAKFLKALGYLSTFDRPPEVDERIQMHADKLYHQMLEQESAIEAAKAEGRPIPSFPPLLAPKPKVESKATASQSTEPKMPVEIGDLREKIQGPLRKKLDTLTGEQRDLEEEAIKAEIQAGTQVAERLNVLNKQAEEERKLRREQGRETLGDKIYSIFRAQ